MSLLSTTGRGKMEVGYESVWKCLKMKSLLGPLVCMVFLRVGLEGSYHEQVIREKVELHLRK